MGRKSNCKDKYNIIATLERQENGKLGKENVTIQHPKKAVTGRKGVIFTGQASFGARKP